MKQQPGISVRAVVWRRTSETRGLAPVWVSRKAYDRAAALLMKTARPPYEKQLLKARLAPLRVDLKKTARTARRATGANQDTCDYVVTPDPMPEISGMVQVWVPVRTYDALATPVLRNVKGAYARTLLRRRMAPLGLDAECKGTCYGGWCREVPVSGDESAAAYVCECSYFV